MNSQWRLIGLGAILLLIGVGARAIEEPAYTVVDQWQDGDIEIRSYEPRVWAVTEMDQSQNQGFRVLAGYIFGGNKQGEEIAMTAPVKSSMSGAAINEMAFMMPSAYDMADLPDPLDERVEFRQADSYLAAVIRFSGWATNSKNERKWRDLSEFIAGTGYVITGEPTINQYNPPWTPPFMRRNEIIVEVALKGSP